MSLFSSFIFPTNSFLSWIDKSFLGLARVSIGTKPSYFFRYFLAAIKSFPEKSHITYLYLFSQSSKYSTISSVHRSFLFTSFCFTPMFFFLFASRFHSTCIVCSVCYFSLLTCMCSQEQITSARQVTLPGALIWGKTRDSSSRRYIGIGYPIYRLFHIKQVGYILLTCKNPTYRLAELYSLVDILLSI